LEYTPNNILDMLLIDSITNYIPILRDKFTHVNLVSVLRTKFKTVRYKSERNKNRLNSLTLTTYHRSLSPKHAIDQWTDGRGL